MNQYLLRGAGRRWLCRVIVAVFVFGVLNGVLNATCAGNAQDNSAPAPADSIYVSGTIYTMNDDQPVAEAMAIRAGKIVRVGNDEQVMALKGDSTVVFDLDGRTVVPGFIESHGHLLGLGELLLELNLTEAASWDEIVALVEAAVANAEPGTWIVGRGWHQSLWNSPPTPNIDGYPLHNALSVVSPDNPVLLVHRSGHMSLANGKAMSEAGISRATPDPSGGELLRDEDGEPIGVFRETAQGLVSRALSKSRQNMTAADLQLEWDRKFEKAQEECLAKGVTTFVDAGTSPGGVMPYVRRIEAGQMDMRVWLMLRSSNTELARRIPELKKYHRFGNHHLTVGGIKQMVDGALGAHGAWLLEPYADLPDSRGLEVAPIANIRQAAELAYEHQLQLCVHAIGDRANREMLDLFEPFVKRTGEDRELRWRIEHAQHLSPEDIPRFAELGVIASMQANHCTSDGPFVPDRLGVQRAAEGAYVWQSLLKSGAKIANGTDAPVEPVDPIACFYSAVTRMMRNGEPFYPQQAMTREQALRSYTLDAAYAIFEDDVKGSLEAGKLADFVVLNQDLLQVPDDEILQTKVDLTVIGGDVVFER